MTQSVHTIVSSSIDFLYELQDGGQICVVRRIAALAYCTLHMVGQLPSQLSQVCVLRHLRSRQAPPLITAPLAPRCCPYRSKSLTVYLVVTVRAVCEELDVWMTRPFSGVTSLWHRIGKTRNCTTAEALTAKPLLCFFGNNAELVELPCLGS